jgi:hypothetical protein
VTVCVSRQIILTWIILATAPQALLGEPAPAQQAGELLRSIELDMGVVG